MVSVASGKVLVNIINEINENILLEKDRQLKIDKATGNFEKYTIDAERYLSWTDGTLYFNDTPIREVVNMLNRSCAQMVFELAGGEYSDLISGKLNTKSLETMLDAYIESFELQYKKTGNHIFLYKNKNNNNE
jgi:ferric-dicitrate binding protein FerR (iron transport regulator)